MVLDYRHHPNGRVTGIMKKFLHQKLHRVKDCNCRYLGLEEEKEVVPI
jgi:hypothetical protein